MRQAVKVLLTTFVLAMPVRLLFLLALGLVFGVCGFADALAAGNPAGAVVHRAGLDSHMGRLMLMAFGAVVVVFFRQTLGIRMLGPVRPILIALAFQFTGFVIGSLFIVGTMTVIALVRPALRQARIPYFGRIAIVLNIVALLIIFTIKMSQQYDMRDWLAVGMLPVVVLTFASDGFARTLNKEGLVSAAWRALTTILIAGLVHLLVASPHLMQFIRDYPVILFVQVLLILLISKKMNFQVFAFINPKPNVKPVVTKSKSSRKKSPKAINQKPTQHRIGSKRSPKMKIAVVRNREKLGILYENGKKSPESYGRNSVQRIIDALRAGGHEIKILEGDITLFDGLKSFIPPDERGQATGLVFNLSYGIQGDCRYTHLPAMLEMIGIPYTGANPLGQAICLDKVVTKQLLQKEGLPTPEMAVLSKAHQPVPKSMRFPLIVKPRHESSSLGIRVVHNRSELVAAAAHVIETFKQDALVEEYVDGREICVGLLGNGSELQVLPIVEIDFRNREFPVLTKADKFHKSEDEPEKVCPAPLDRLLQKRIEKVVRRAFHSCHCRDYARVDMRIGKDGVPYIIEINSMASLGQGGSYVLGAKEAGYTFTSLIGKIAESAAKRNGLLYLEPKNQSLLADQAQAGRYPLQLAVNY